MLPQTTPHVGAVNHSTILTKQQAADYLQATPRYIERQIRAGRLRACKPTGKFVRIFRKDVDAFLESCASMEGVE